MVNIPVITKRELNTYFLSPIAYVVLTGFALAHGILFALGVGPRIEPNIQVYYAFYITLFLLILAAPLLTMRLISEESDRGTIETLMTTPVTEAEVVLGKFVGALVFAAVMFAPIAVEMVFLRFLGPVDVGPLLAGFLGLFLLTGQLLAIGLLCSALTRIQIASAIISFATLIGLYFLWFMAQGSGGTWAAVLRYISPPWHYVSFPKGIVDTRDVAYFVITTALFLFLTVRALQLRKWR